MYRQGASVALTALTKAVAFLGPVIVLRIPALQQFCVVVSISICFEVILAFFCFCPMLVSKGLHSSLPIPGSPLGSDRVSRTHPHP